MKRLVVCWGTGEAASDKGGGAHGMVARTSKTSEAAQKGEGACRFICVLYLIMSF